MGSLLSIFDFIPAWVTFLPIAVCSVILLAVVIERLIFFRIAQSTLASDLDKFFAALSTGGREKALGVAVQSGSIIVKSLSVFFQIPDGHDPAVYFQFVAEKTQRKIERYIAVVSTIATISPMFGLLGTITGMMKSFGALSKSGASSQELLAAGIAEALLTTAFGLIVAIPALIFHNYLISKSSALVKELEINANRLMQNE
ncbi:MAG TPA: MotA/TolQ/ExbB proton channel family protein [Spirochaetota bacterium]|nr:MotA/TolQ/ExbB proton channel family protein [Spirochaetota bacterium]HPA63042.1 MotA/TolQ/ExbB proton channel family protein [Spirochaetota bacterium]HQO21703.1 MotA/TolQ/ExbB proton channel family protein [Spirochaetota bacterium]HQQ22430.1 MotA/TolQ/ExbB proton channel family protein [Spirochaetota bacterium]